MDILAIGNSFSQDATRYLEQIAHAQGEVLNVFNLYIGGCSLERHFRNMKSGESAYTLEFNGKSTGFSISLKEALLGRSREWDVITLQQASHFSGKKEAYDPSTQALVSYIRDLCPRAKLYIHETWAYEEGSAMLQKNYPDMTSEDMYQNVVRCYHEIEKEVGFDGLIPSGELMHALLENGIPKIHRDGYHLSYGLGRYAAGLLWFRMLTGKSVSENTYADFDEPVSAEEMALAKRLVDAVPPLV